MASKTIRIIQDLSSALTLGIFVVAAVLLGAAGLLILNTIRMAMFARRREIEVMKLVGATNWFIRVPFMLEGLVQGMLGAVAGHRHAGHLPALLPGLAAEPEEIPLVSGFTVSGGEPVRHLRAAGRGGALVGTSAPGWPSPASSTSDPRRPARRTGTGAGARRDGGRGSSARGVAAAGQPTTAESFGSATPVATS